MNIYLISGLGADERIFRSLHFPEGYKIHYIKWVDPVSSRESLEDYCFRLSTQIETADPFILLGLSFGGMVCCALNDIIKPYKTIIISSVATKKEVPVIYRLAGISGITHILPGSMPHPMMKIMEWYMGVETEEDRELVTAFIKEGSSRFNKWAMIRAAAWSKENMPENFSHIHGSGDRIFPICNTKAGYIIKGGGHFMVLNKAREVSAILVEVLNK